MTGGRRNERNAEKAATRENEPATEQRNWSHISENTTTGRNSSAVAGYLSLNATVSSFGMSRLSVGLQ